MTARSDRSPRRRQLAHIAIELPADCALSGELLRAHAAFEVVTVIVNGATGRYNICQSDTARWWSNDPDDIRTSFILEEKPE